jgi:hypothetical protein
MPAALDQFRAYLFIFQSCLLAIGVKPRQQEVKGLGSECPIFSGRGRVVQRFAAPIWW